MSDNGKTPAAEAYRGKIQQGKPIKTLLNY